MRPRWLVKTILELTRRRMESRPLTQEQRRSLTERRLAECLELLTPRSVTSGDQVGRQTGSLAWRLARGELGEVNTDTQWVWEPSEADMEAGVMTLEYSVVEDVYRTGVMVREGFMSGLWSGRNVARKVEHDWNMAYIARVEGTGAKDKGEAEWRLRLPNSVSVDRLELLVDSKTFQSGAVRWQLCTDKICLMPTPGVQLDTRQFAGAREISLHATLSGGDGDNAWQHTQLFRSSTTGEENGPKLKLVVYFKPL